MVVRLQKSMRRAYFFGSFPYRFLIFYCQFLCNKFYLFCNKLISLLHFNFMYIRLVKDYLLIFYNHSQKMNMRKRRLVLTVLTAYNLERFNC